MIVKNISTSIEEELFVMKDYRPPWEKLLEEVKSKLEKKDEEKNDLIK